jgi:hypothetical protein
VAEPRPGEGVDPQGNPAVDPTKNVLDLVAAEGRRVDQALEAAEKLSDTKHAHAKEIGDLRAAHARELDEKESQRLDAIRDVDVAAAALDRERAAAAASALAMQVSVSASTLRDLVATTADAAAKAAAAIYTPLAERIAQLERASYEGSGKSAERDPQLARMAATIEALSRNMSEGQGKNDGRVDLRSNTSMIVIIIGAIIAAITLYNSFGGAAN